MNADKMIYLAVSHSEHPGDAVGDYMRRTLPIRHAISQVQSLYAEHGEAWSEQGSFDLYLARPSEYLICLLVEMEEAAAAVATAVLTWDYRFKHTLAAVDSLHAVTERLEGNTQTPNLNKAEAAQIRAALDLLKRALLDSQAATAARQAA